MLNQTLLASLACPETRTSLQEAPAALIASLNRQIDEGTLVNASGRTVTERLTGGLVCFKGTRLYPIVNDIPIVLIGESIPV